jgi:glutamate racemase
MREIIGPKINLIDSACEVAKEVQEVLSKKGLLREENDGVSHKFFVTDAPEKFVKIGEKFLGRKISEEVRYMRSS